MKPEPSGGAVVAWVERRGAAHLGHVRIAAARAGQAFGSPADFKGPASTPRELSLAALDDGSAVAGWTLDCGDRGTHVLVGRRRADGALSQPREVSGPRARPVPPAVALDPTGKPAVLWATRRLNGRPVFRVSTR